MAPNSEPRLGNLSKAKVDAKQGELGRHGRTSLPYSAFSLVNSASSDSLADIEAAAPIIN